MRRLLRRLRYLLRPQPLDAEVLRELDFHRDMIRRDLEAQGLPPDEAAHAAQRQLGSIAVAREQVRDVWIAPWVQSAWQDARFAARLLLKHRSFTLVAVTALALGIGVNSTLFAIVNAYCLRGLPIDDAARVVFVTMQDAKGQEARVSQTEFEAVREAASTLAGTSAFESTAVVIAEDGRAAERVQRTSMSANAFGVIGRQPMLGRDFRVEDAVGGAPAVVILSGGLWQTRYGGDPNVIGRIVRINGTPATVIGVMPERFTFPNHTDVWQPLLSQPSQGRALGVFGRLAPNKSVADARAEIAAIATRVMQEPRDRSSRLRPSVVPINERFSGRITDPAWMAFTIVGFLVVLIACANVANLLLMRSADRAREIAIRVSLGATSRRIVRQVLIESTVLAALGGAVGLVLALLGLRLIVTAIPEPFIPPAGIEIDVRVLAMLAMVCLGTVFVFGLVPARQLSRITMPARSSHTRRWTAVFMTGEVALTMILLAHVSWNARAIVQGRQADAVIDTSHLLTWSISLPQERYRAADARLAFHDQLRERLRSMPSVTAVATATALPFAGAARRQLIIDNRATPAGQPTPTAWTLTVSPQYFESLRLQIRDGRAFVDLDGTAGHERVIVNQRFADLYFHDDPIIGRRIQLRTDGAPTASAPTTSPSVTPWLTIVGIAANLRQRPQLDPDPIVYLPLPLDPPATTALLLRTTGDPGALAAPVREAVRALDPDLPVDRVASLEDALATARWNTRLSNNLVIVIASIALLLAMIGLYTLTAHAVAQRTREIGIRMALGAAPRTIAWLILRRALLQLSIGLIAGVLVTLLWARIFEAGPRTGTSAHLTDPLTLLPVAALLVVVAIAACLHPARRATRNDPVSALRCQ